MPPCRGAGGASHACVRAGVLVPVQGETRQSIERALREAGNRAPLATRIIRARKREAGQVYIPPAIYDLGDDE